MKKGEAAINRTRRDMLKSMAGSAVAAGLATHLLDRQVAAADTSRTHEKTGAANGQYIILFSLTEQERYMRPSELPEGYRLPAHERLIRQGIVFENHRINSCVCTPSRSVLYTGQHIQRTHVRQHQFS